MIMNLMVQADRLTSKNSMITTQKTLMAVRMEPAESSSFIKDF